MVEIRNLVVNLGARVVNDVKGSGDFVGLLQDNTAQVDRT